MALRNKDGWPEEELDSISTIKIDDNTIVSIAKGAVLYQVVAMFDYGLPILFAENKEWKVESGLNGGAKERRFNLKHKKGKEGTIAKTKDYGMCLLQDINRQDNTRVRDLRNKIDHLSYFRKKDQSIWELYSEFYVYAFNYSSKLRKSVLKNFENVLEKYFLEVVSLEFDREGKKITLGGINSKEFTYKNSNAANRANNQSENKKQKGNNRDGEYNLPARSSEFVDKVTCVLTQ